MPDLDDFLYSCPVDEVEKAVGDKVSDELAFVLIRNRHEQRTELLKSIGDTPFDLDWREWLELIKESGFELVFHETLPSKKWNKVRYFEVRYYVKNGLILVTTSFECVNETRNSADIFFECIPKKLNDIYNIPHGSRTPNNFGDWRNMEIDEQLEKGLLTFTFSIDVREAFFYKLRKIEQYAGQIIVPWRNKKEKDLLKARCCDSKKPFPKQLTDICGE